MVTTLSIPETEQPQQPQREARVQGVVRDIAILGAGTALAGLLNVAVVFVVPRFLTVEDYGYWRLFGLYAGYAGLLHFGFADGALLRWAGRPMQEFRHEVRPALSYLFWQHVAVLLPLCLVAALVLHGPLRVVALAVAIYAVLSNEATLLQFGFQSARVFWPVAISAAMPPGLFVGLVLLWRWRAALGYREVTALYTAGWLFTLFVLLAWIRSAGGERGRTAKGFAKRCLATGWPIVLSNTAVMLIAYSDRLAVSWSAPIREFAQYSLAASAMGVPIMAIQGCSQVVFPHLAAQTAQDRRSIYRMSSQMVLMAWAILLPYYFALDLFVRHFLPKYLPSLLYARVLLLGIPFLAAIQILQMNYAYLNGLQRQFLVWTAGVLAVSLATLSFVAFRTHLLVLVAGAQVALLAGWWMFNEWKLRNMTGQAARDWIRFAGVYVLAGTSYVMTTARAGGAPVFVLAYYLCLAIVLGPLCRNELRMWRVQWRIMA